MANALKHPWICDYLIEVAEEYGANISGIPPHPLTKKAQLIKFLTHPKPDEDSWVWATISDKVYTIPVRFSKEAVAAYRSNPQTGCDLTELKTAFIQLKSFRPMLARVPSGGRMSDVARLWLEVKEFEVKGSYGAEVWSSPTDVETEQRIRVWAEGLRSDGGGGNVLKIAKQERELKSHEEPKEVLQRYPKVAAKKAPINHPVPRSKLLTRQSARKTYHSYSEQDAVETQPRDMKAYKSIWRRVSRKPHLHIPPAEMSFDDVPFAGQSDEEKEPPGLSKRPDSAVKTPKRPRRRNALDLSTQDSSQAQRSPSNWSISGYGDDDGDQDERSSSVQGSPMKVDEGTAREAAQPTESLSNGVMLLEAAEGNRTQSTDIPTSSVSAPTPAQRQKPSIPSSSLPNPSNTGNVLVPDSSLPAPLLSIPSLQPGLPPAQMTCARKVPGPRDQSVHPDLSTIGRILVPNSDTSGTATYSQPSQAQSQSQDLSHDSQSQGQRFAQSLSYSPKSQEQEQAQRPDVAGDSESVESQMKSEPRSQELSQLRSEILPSEAQQIDRAPTNAPDAAPELMPAELTLDNSLEANPPLPRDLHSMPIADPNDDQELAEDAHFASSPAHTPVDDTTRPATPPPKASPSQEDAGVSNEPDPLPSDDTVSMNDVGGELSDENLSQDKEEDQLSSDDARMDITLNLSRRTHSRISRETTSTRGPKPRGKSSSPGIVPDSQPEPEKEPEAEAAAVCKPLDSAASEPPTALPITPPNPDVFYNEASFQGGASSKSSYPEQALVLFGLAGDDDRKQRIKPAVEETQKKKPQESKLPTGSNHDAAMWASPAFLQKGSKRPRSPSSSTSSSIEEKPKKKRRQTAVLPGSNISVEITHIPSIAKPVQQPQSATSSASVERAGGLIREASITAGMKQIDLTRSGSMASVNSTRRSRDGSKHSSIVPAPRSSVDVTMSSDQSRSRREGSGRNSRPSLPRSASSEVSSEHGSRRSHGTSGSVQAGPSRVKREEAGSVVPTASQRSGQDPPAAADNIKPVKSSALGALRAALDFSQVDGPPSVTWERLERIMRSTGKTRYLELNKGGGQ
ncbi:hypothetical protein BXZ70DRAFT_27293 [Cristinia sonorae]|uniref:Telomere replication protein EST3 n=1 Tax=Cristinia sonorae TaxID=1940300 RepID=A0A8K0V0H0_9AGAR|nr:hypothetical protein BXZ70DRAFT_27293 [Cristinia sonorae]